MALSRKCVWLVALTNSLQKISTRRLIMKVDFCPALCITEKPILRAFGAFSHFVWYRGVSSNYSETAREKRAFAG